MVAALIATTRGRIDSFEGLVFLVIAFYACVGTLAAARLLLHHKGNIGDFVDELRDGLGDYWWVVALALLPIFLLVLVAWLGQEKQRAAGRRDRRQDLRDAHDDHAAATDARAARVDARDDARTDRVDTAADGDPKRTDAPIDDEAAAVRKARIDAMVRGDERWE